MRVIATLTIDGIKETIIVGDAAIFDNKIRPWLSDVGFWLVNWRYAGPRGPNHKSNVFVPWASCLMMVTLDEVKR